MSQRSSRSTEANLLRLPVRPRHAALEDSPGNSAVYVPVVLRSRDGIELVVAPEQAADVGSMLRQGLVSHPEIECG